MYNLSYNEDYGDYDDILGKYYSEIDSMLLIVGTIFLFSTLYFIY